ncbi:unnamed protein product [Schistosoma mattheei]|uniref:Uncharacterized protein n=1 Tax=Schistosoma mattheei TaxID=31246 RepID=A0A183PET0_9TREM|nr:unnamed protein product [Schistosoma mattheei]
MQAFQPEFRSSTLGFLRAIHYGMGRGLGAIFGGLVISSYVNIVPTDLEEESNVSNKRLFGKIINQTELPGTPAMFRAYGAASALVLLGFLLLNYFMPIPAASEESNEDDKMYGQISSDGRSSNTGQFGNVFQTTEVTHDYYLQNEQKSNQFQRQQ